MRKTLGAEMGFGNLHLKPVEVVDDLGKEDFEARYFRPGIPVILKNYMASWPAKQIWTYSYLRKKIGHHSVKLYGKWLENEPTRIEMPHVKEVPFAEYIDILESGQPSDLRIFLFNPFKLSPELLADFNFPDCAVNYLKDFPYLFFGAAGSDVRLHYDIDLSHVFISQFAGTKRIVLFNQNQTKYLYKLPFATHSAADLMALDFEKYPGLKYATGYECMLKPGETLYMPSGMWHYIQYIDASFSLSLRTISSSHIGKLKGLYNVLVIRKLDEYLNKYYGQEWGEYKLRKAIVRTNNRLVGLQK